MADVGFYTCHPWHFMEFQCLSQYIDELTMPLTIVFSLQMCMLLNCHCQDELVLMVKGPIKSISHLSNDP